MNLGSRTIKLIMILGLVLFLGFVLLGGGVVGTTFANGTGEDGLELTIDSRSIYNDVFQPNLSWELKDLVPGVDQFFNFDDVKPGDTGLQSISIHVEKNPAYVCLDFSELTEAENGMTEPESLVDVTLGADLAAGTEFFAWRDDGDLVYDPGERPLFGTTSQSAVQVFNDATYTLSDSNTEIFEVGATYYVGIMWCAGDLEVDLATGVVSCDATTLGNEAQTDSFSVDVSLRAVEANSFTDFTCVDPSIDLYLEKKFSGSSEGFAPEQFSFHVVGNDVDAIVPHGSFVALPVGFFTITELAPEGFEAADWNIRWNGDLCSGETAAASVGEIEVLARDLAKETTYCRVENRYDLEKGNNGHGNDEDHNDDSNPGASNDPADDTDDDGLPPGQQAAGGPPGRQQTSGDNWVIVPEQEVGQNRFERLLAKLTRV